MPEHHARAGAVPPLQPPASRALSGVMSSNGSTAESGHTRHTAPQKICCPTYVVRPLTGPPLHWSAYTRLTDLRREPNCFELGVAKKPRFSLLVLRIVLVYSHRIIPYCNLFNQHFLMNGQLLLAGNLVFSRSTHADQINVD